MADARNNFARSKAPRATARSDGEDPILWADREIDIAALRQWFIRRVAAEALEQIKREQGDER